MKLKRFVAWFVVFVLLLGMVGCTTEGISYEDDLEDESPLKVYLLWGVIPDGYMVKFAMVYNLSKPKGNRPIELTEFYWDEREAMYEQILNEMALGKGPDIITINEEMVNYIDIHKLTNQDAFADMDILIENNGTFDLNDYNKLAMDTGIINGKRVFMPMTYRVNYSIGVEKCFDHHGLTIPQHLSLDAYFDILDKYYQNTTRPAMLGIDPLYLLSQFIEVGKPIEKSEELRRLIDFIYIEKTRAANEKAVYNEVAHSMHYGQFFRSHEQFVKSNYLFLDSNMSLGFHEFSLLHRHYNAVEKWCGEDMILFTQPLDKDSPTKAYVNAGLAINANSKHKNEAFDFVAYLLSKPVQSPGTVPDIPVHTQSYEGIKKDFEKGYDLYNFGAYSGFTGVFDPVPDETPVPEDMMEQFINYVDGVEEYEFIGNLRYIYHNIMNESLEDYYHGLITYDQMIDEINNKLAIYYSE